MKQKTLPRKHTVSLLSLIHIYRALALSDLTTIHQKTPIGRLSAYCGAVSAGAGAGAGIAYLEGGDYETVIHTVCNACLLYTSSLSIHGGQICSSFYL